jgi:hypothetical protein
MMAHQERDHTIIEEIKRQEGNDVWYYWNYDFIVVGGGG